MKAIRLFFAISISLLCINSFSQSNTAPGVYNPNADAKTDIAAALKKAAAENKQVLLQVGGNWCSWCIRLHKLINSDQKIDSTLKANYIFVLVNYSKENKNLPLLKELEFPQRFGFPVWVILNKEGRRIHTQATDLLESGEGYDNKKILGVLNGWSSKALDSAQYPDK